MKYTNKLIFPAVVAASAMALTACSDSDDVSNLVQSTTEAVSIQFAAQVNGQDFTCDGIPNTGVGTKGSDYNVTDFRLYIHDAHIHDELTGEEYEIELTQDGKWQLDDVAMLDFEDGTNGCVGTLDTNSEIVGQVTIPATIDLSATEVCFEVGLPADKNHLDTTDAEPPLNSVDMLWAWKLGRKYVKIDGVGGPGVEDEAFKLHLGAQGCPAGAGNEAPVTACTVPNTFEVCVADFDVANDVVAVDPAPVFEMNDITANLSVNVPMNPAAPKPGCQSFIDDLDCEEIMPRLGLNYDYGRVSITGAPSAYTGEQKLFSKQ